MAGGMPAEVHEACRLEVAGRANREEEGDEDLDECAPLRRR